MHPRIAREKRMVGKMIKVYCHQRNNEELCPDCENLKAYANKKLLRCPFAKDKPVCSKCSIHCYNSKKREQIKKVMRYAGPKMILRHPLDTLLYFYNKIIFFNYTPT